MSTSDDTGGSLTSAAAEALGSAETVARRIRSRRWWYITGAIVMAVALAGFTITLASWPDRLADVIVPGLLVVLALLVVLGMSGRTVPASAIPATNYVVLVSAVLIVVTLLLNRLLLPDGFSVWVVLTASLPALPFLYLAGRVARA